MFMSEVVSGVLPTFAGGQSAVSFVSQTCLAENLPNRDMRIVQVGGEKYFDRFHIPGAVLLPYHQLVEKREGVAGLRADEEALAERFGRLGIGVDTPVVAYDLSGGPDGARLIWTLASLGHEGGGYLLDGGLGRWYEEKRPLEQACTEVQSTTFGLRPNLQWEMAAEEILATAQGERGGLLLDVRSEKEYRGATLQGPRGHIPKARHLEWTTLLRSPRDVRLKEPTELAERLAQVGVTDQEQEIIPYCETGHRASQTWLLLRHMGYRRVRLYDGSMAEWRVRGWPVVDGVNPE